MNAVDRERVCYCGFEPPTRVERVRSTLGQRKKRGIKITMTEKKEEMKDEKRE